jgi:hypothetical protein
VAEADQDGPRHPGEQVVGSGIRCRPRKCPGGGQASAETIVPAAGQLGGDLVGQRQQRGDHRPGAHGEQGRGHPHHLVARMSGRQPDVTGRQHHRAGCDGQALQVVDGERAVGQHDRGEHRVVGPEPAVRRDVGDVSAVECPQRVGDRGFSAG